MPITLRACCVGTMCSQGCMAGPQPQVELRTGDGPTSQAGMIPSTSTAGTHSYRAGQSRAAEGDCSRHYIETSINPIPQDPVPENAAYIYLCIVLREDKSDKLQLHPIGDGCARGDLRPKLYRIVLRTRNAEEAKKEVSRENYHCLCKRPRSATSQGPRHGPGSRPK